MAYNTEVLADSPFLYWRLADSAGTTVTDLGSGGHNGTYSGDYTLDDEYLAEGVAPNKAVRLNSTLTTGAIESGTITGIPSTALTIEAWMREAPASTNDTIFAYGNASFANAIQLRMETDQVQLYINGNLVSSGIVGTRIFEQGLHIAVTWDNAAGDYVFYINGTIRGTGTVAAAATIADSGLVVVGQRWNAAPPVTATYLAGDDLKGWVQEVALYPTVLTAARIRVHWLEGRRAHSLTDPDSPAYDYPNVAYGLVDLSTVGQDFYQRIYDDGVKQYVYYTKAFVDPTPLASETTPNHGGQLVAATHEVIDQRPAG